MSSPIDVICAIVYTALVIVSLCVAVRYVVWWIKRRGSDHE